jgi:hypothetical protein
MLNNFRIYLLGIFSALFCSLVFSAGDVRKYVAVHKESDTWKVISVTDTIPTYKPGMEIISLPSFQPQYANNRSRSDYGGYDCPIAADESKYDLCNSYFFSFVGANWFGLGGKRVGFRQDRLSEVSEAISSDPTVAKLLVEYQTAAAERDAKEKEIADRRKSENDARLKKIREEQEKVEKEASEAAIAKFTQMERGSEDSCRRIRYNNDTLNCQFGGIISLYDLKVSGWLVISEKKDNDGYPYEYYVRKAR